MWLKIAAFLVRKRVLLLIVLGLFTGFMAYEARKVSIAYDFAKVIPKDDSDYIDYTAFKQKFGEDGSVMVLGVQSDKLFQLPYFKAWYKLTESIQKLNGIEKVVSISHIYKIDKVESRDEFGDDNGHFAIGRMFQKPPETQNELDSLAKVIKNLSFYKGLLINEKGDVTLMGITLKKEQLDSKDRIALVAQIEELANIFQKEQNTEVHFSGLPYIRTIYATKIRNELQMFTLFSVLITMVIMWFFFRSLVAVGYSLVVVVLGVVFTLGTVGLMGYKVTALIGLVPPLIVIIGIQNCIYLFNVYHQEYRKNKSKMLSITRVTAKNGLALFLTNVTTAVGFGVFNFTGSSLLDDFSVVSAINIMVIYVLSAIFLPIVYSYLPAPTQKQTKHLDNVHMSGLMQWCNRVVMHHRKWIYGIVAVLTLVSVWGFMQVRAIGYIVDDLPKKDKVYTDLRFFEHHFHGVMPLEISVDSKKKATFKNSISSFEKMDSLQKILSEYPQLSKPVSLLEMIKFASQAFHNYNPQSYALPPQEEFVALRSYLKLNKKSGNNQLMKGLVDSTWQTARISVQMADIGSVETEKLRNELRLRVDSIFNPKEYDVKLTGTSIIFLKGNSYLINNLTGSMALALLINSLLMAMLFFSWRMILISLVPNILPLIMTLGIMGYFDIHLKPSTIIIFSITYGISIDFTIHFLAKYRYFLKKNNWAIGPAVTETIIESGVSIVYTSVILFCGFIIFAFSTFGGTVALGVLTSITLLIGMVLNLLLLPAMLMWLEKIMNMKKEMNSGIIELEE